MPLACWEHVNVEVPCLASAGALLLASNVIYPASAGASLWLPTDSAMACAFSACREAQELLAFAASLGFDRESVELQVGGCFCCPLSSVLLWALPAVGLSLLNIGWLLWQARTGRCCTSLL